MFAGRCVTLTLTIVTLLVAPAWAAEAVDDTLVAAPNGALDVFANDVDPDTDPLNLTATGEPAHGTVSCSALGACLYEAEKGFTGSDSFSYTVSAPNSAPDTAFVSVTVAAPTGTAVTARDDRHAILAGNGIKIDVLANDEGASPLTVDASTAPVHGSAVCLPQGTCSYHPEVGFSGRDGFTYVLRDGSGTTRRAAVQIAVTPANSAYGLSVAGRALDPFDDGIAPDGAASWFARSEPSPDSLADDELEALPRPAVAIRLDGPHKPAAPARTARGWELDSSSTEATLSAHATSSALLGSAASQHFPPPQPSIHQGNGGDGHVPILVGRRVFAFFHHQFPTSVSCVDRSTGATCPGYPKQLNVGTTDINGPAVVVGTRIWTHLLMASWYPRRGSIGLYCWDAAADTTCGMTIVDRAMNVPLAGNSPGASAPVLADGKIWFGAVTKKLYCVDPATGEPCDKPWIDTGTIGGGPSGDAGPHMDIVAHGTRVFLSRGPGPAAATCVDVTARAHCPGWETTKAIGGRWNLVNEYDAAGTAVGVCLLGDTGTVPGFSDGRCFRDADPATGVAMTNFPQTEDYYSATQEAETGTRTLIGHNTRDGLGCYDWTTRTPCAGGKYDAAGFLATDRRGQPLSSAYGAVFDGRCVVALGDPGVVYTVDPAGSAPCWGTTETTRTIDLRAQRCDEQVGAARWRNVAITDSDSTELEQVTVTVRDAQTHAVLAQGDVIGRGAIDLSAIDPVAHPAILVESTLVTSVNQANDRAPWDDGVPPRLVVNWTPDAQHICMETQGQSPCAATAGTVPATFTGTLATPAVDRSVSLPLHHRACGGSSPPDPEPAPAPSSLAKAPEPSSSAPPVGPSKGSSSRPHRKCTGRRHFRIHVRYRGADIRRIRVLANGKRQRVIQMLPRPVADINLRTRPKQKTIVRIVIRTKSARIITGKRVYHPCTRRLPDYGFTL